MIHHILAAAPGYRENRVIDTSSFVAGCVWLLMLFLSEGFRNWQRWVPGGLISVIILDLLIIGIAAYLLH